MGHSPCSLNAPQGCPLQQHKTPPRHHPRRSTCCRNLARRAPAPCHDHDHDHGRGPCCCCAASCRAPRCGCGCATGPCGVVWGEGCGGDGRIEWSGGTESCDGIAWMKGCGCGCGAGCKSSPCVVVGGGLVEGEDGDLFDCWGGMCDGYHLVGGLRVMTVRGNGPRGKVSQVCCGGPCTECLGGWYVTSWPSAGRCLRLERC